jgi:hypothetical protein
MLSECSRVESMLGRWFGNENCQIACKHEERGRLELRIAHARSARVAQIMCDVHSCLQINVIKVFELARAPCSPK